MIMKEEESYNLNIVSIYFSGGHFTLDWDGA